MADQYRNPYAHPSDNAQAGQMQSPGQRVTALDCVNKAFSSSLDLSVRVQQIVERICGSVPESATAVGNPAKPAGVLPALEDAAIMLESSLSRAHLALDRLERELP